MGGIYLIQSDDQLIEMMETAYDSEELLQVLLAEYPSILAGDQINPSAPRRWLLVRREVGVPAREGGGARWSLDHLFLDQDGIPTLVEVKRSTDTRTRREVVAQMLDYAANAVVHWPIETIQAEFEAHREEPDQALEEFLEGADAEEFWQKTKTNLQAGKIRLVFVADGIPPELRRIVEFLNGQMDPAEVLAVEIKQYVGGDLKTLVPRVVGQTADAQIKKAGGSVRQWDERSFMEELGENRDESERRTAKRILEWMAKGGLNVWWGQGPVYGSVGPILEQRSIKHWLFRIYSDGNVQLNIRAMKVPFDNDARRSEVIARLNSIPDVEIPADGKRVYRKLSVFAQDSSLAKFLETFDWIIEEIKKT